MAQLPHVVIQILPTHAGMHPGRIGTFTLLHLTNQPNIAWTPGPGNGRFTDHPDHVTEYTRRYDHLTATAHPPQTSMKAITALTQ